MALLLILPTAGKTRITIYLDDVILAKFKAESERTGKGYQTLINDALAKHASGAEQPVTATQVRNIVPGRARADAVTTGAIGSVRGARLKHQ